MGLPAPEPLRNAIEGWRRGFSDLPVRWLSGSDLHLTLVPPWQGEAEEEIEKLQTLAGASSPIDIRFQKIAFGPDPKRPRLIWAEGEYDPRLGGLRDDLRTTLKFEAEERRLFPHITLARFPEAAFADFPIKKLDEETHWTARFESFALYESHLFPGGAEYEILKEFRLR